MASPKSDDITEVANFIASSTNPASSTLFAAGTTGSSANPETKSAEPLEEQSAAPSSSADIVKVEPQNDAQAESKSSVPAEPTIIGSESPSDAADIILPPPVVLKDESTVDKPIAQTTTAIGFEEESASSTSIKSPPEKTVRISLLLTNGNRHPFTITPKYLQKRNISATDGDPWNISVYDMKNLIFQDWLSAWEERPLSPTSIRLIFLGGLLDDKLPLRDCRLNRTEPNVVHMTIKPQDFPEDEEIKSKETKGNRGDRENRSGSSCCVIL